MNFSNRPSQNGSPLPKTFSVLTGIASGVVALFWQRRSGEELDSDHMTITADCLRSNFNVVIASTALSQARMIEAGKAIGCGLAHVSGGSTLSPIIGLWTIGADQDILNGAIEVADGVSLRVTVPINKSAELYTALQNVVSDVCEKFSIPAEWIHVEVTLQTAAHFQIPSQTINATQKEETKA